MINDPSPEETQIERSESFTGSQVAVLTWSIVRVLMLVATAATLFFTTAYPIPSTIAVGAVLAMLLYVDRSLVFRTWAALVTGIVMFTHIRSLADLTFIPTRYQYVIDIDRLLFFGQTPTVWLQGRFYEFGRTTTFDSFMVSIHLSYFVVPFGLAIGLAFWSRQHFIRYTAGLLGTYYLGLVIYFLTPTSPPWLASLEGYLPEITRIVQVLGTDVSPEAYRQGYQVAGANDVAAMPSLHFGITALIMLAHWSFPWIIRGVFLVYTALMGLALVYLAEHYVVDLIVGFIVALAAWWLANRWYRRYAEQSGVDEEGQPTVQG